PFSGCAVPCGLVREKPLRPRYQEAGDLPGESDQRDWHCCGSVRQVSGFAIERFQRALLGGVTKADVLRPSHESARLGVVNCLAPPKRQVARPLLMRGYPHTTRKPIWNGKNRFLNSIASGKGGCSTWWLSSRSL